MIQAPKTNIRWQSYPLLEFDPDELQEQLNALCDTGLYLSAPKIWFKYLPRKIYQDFEDNCTELMNAIRVQESQVEICNETFYTTRIEGARTTKKRTYEIHNGIAIKPDNFESEKMVKNSFEATKMLNLVGSNLTLQKLRKVWEIMVADVCSNEEVRGDLFRSGTIWIGGTEGLPHYELESIMQDWLGYYQSDVDDDTPFFKASILHQSFERIHPFCDGNGRMGRLLMHNYFISKGIDKVKGISFSTEIGNDLDNYYIALQQASNEYFDSTTFIDYMMMHMNLTLSRVYILQNTDWSDRALDMFMSKPMYTKFQCDKFLEKIKTLL